MVVCLLKERVKKIFNNLDKKPDVIIIKNSSEPFIDNNFFYATNLKKGLFEGSVAVLFPDGCIDLIVSRLEEESAKKSDANIKTYEKSQESKELVRESIGSSSCIGLIYNNISHQNFISFKELLLDASFIDVSEGFFKTRVIKDESEIKTIRQACGIVDRVITKIPDICSLGMAEYKLAAEINYLMQKYGADKQAFETISSFGKNSAEPHYTHGDTKLDNGDFVLCDFGANFLKYNSDITRTFVFGKATEKQIEMYNTVLEAQRIGLEKIKPGIKAHEVHDAVNSYIDSTRFKDCFIHSTGHSLGLSVHDGGVGFTSDNETVLEENMVLTVEPGVYIPGFGGVRIEDDIVIKKDGFEFLTKSEKALIEI